MIGRYNPACAGTTALIVSAAALMPIQPRVCGDYEFPLARYWIEPDTTPRVRGLQWYFADYPCCSRYNPACAGTTLLFDALSCVYKIQPSVCGDYSHRLTDTDAIADTTPRVRGLRPSGLAAGDAVRYNPACAGTTRSSSAGTFLSSIQPRVCGDYCCRFCMSSMMVDTTPRVRGLHEVMELETVHSRYNPACAGTTLLFDEKVLVHQIQPRVCGDYLPTSTITRPLADTTPRVRGLHQRISGTRAILS